MKQIIEGVAFMHSEQIIHLDLKVGVISLDTFSHPELLLRSPKIFCAFRRWETVLKSSISDWPANSSP